MASFIKAGFIFLPVAAVGGFNQAINFCAHRFVPRRVGLELGTVQTDRV